MFSCNKLSRIPYQTCVCSFIPFIRYEIFEIHNCSEWDTVTASHGTSRSNSLTTVFEQQFLKQKNSPTHHQENDLSLKTNDLAPLVLLFFYIQVGVLCVLVWCPVRFVDVDFFHLEL